MTVEVDRDPARRAAQHELSDPRYEHQTWWDDFKEWLNRLFSERTGGQHGHGGSLFGGHLLPIVFLVVLIVVGVLVFFVVRRATKNAPKKTGALFDDEQAVLLSSEQHRKRAKAAASAGDWARAIAERLRAVVKELDERGVLTLTAGRTADEFALEAAQLLPALADGFTGAARSFDQVVYGGGLGSERAYLDVAGLDDAIPEAARHARKTDALVVAGDEGPAW